ncbi:MAG: M23 family metallopeptidase, partial [Candidatus Hydrothermae bacterium]|nr:M23 family metallopeptidase [Candidatus Hydrothermae bacterium]
ASPPPVDLHFPLRGGVYAVAHGGSNLLLNAHHPSREQRYAPDMVKLNRLGLRAWGGLPGALSRYAVYGEPVAAPCSGTVVAAVDGLPERVPSLSVRDTLHPAGNHVVLACTFPDRTVHVVLAHLRRGSVRVSVGDTVPAGKILGRVGNSGNTTEPHLHFHACDPATLQGVPVTFRGRFLVRNDVISTRF